MAARRWATEQRQRQREAIQRWKPWNQSKGPKSGTARAAAVRNAYSGGRRAALRNLIKEMNLALRKQQKFLAVYSGR